MLHLIKAGGLHAVNQAASSSNETLASKDTPTGSDLVSLPPFMDMINDPSLIKDLLEQQGVTGVDFVEPTGPLGGGTAGNNYKGYIHWLDGTQTKVQIKGSRDEDVAPTSYREALFYSRMTDTIDGIKTPNTYVGVADIESGRGFQVTEFMIGYSSLRDAFQAYNAGTLSDLGISYFDFNLAHFQAMNLLGHYAASHWMDTSMEDQFFLKGFNWLSGEVDPTWVYNRDYVKDSFETFKQALNNDKDYEID